MGLFQIQALLLLLLLPRDQNCWVKRHSLFQSAILQLI
jgi:hypothetical protein